uniref:Class I SAM-dependent methyltransferase n=1 Tax=candidate division WOR-3 bacterium TaxID=2052148 RepID=A0A7C6EBN6_UNCW3
MKQINVTKKFYDESNYFAEVKVYTDLLTSRFQQYRIINVKKIYSPNPKERVLDLGCALGTFCFALAQQCKEIIGVDYSQKAITIANKLLANSPFRNIKFICSDAQAIEELPADSFDVIISADLFEHLYPNTFEKVLDECKRLLKQGGKLVIWTPHQRHIIEILKNRNIILKKDISHVHYKSMDYLLTNLQKRNFTILKAYYVESHLPIWANLERLLMPVLPIMRRRIAILAKRE